MPLKRLHQLHIKTVASDLIRLNVAGKAPILRRRTNGRDLARRQARDCSTIPDLPSPEALPLLKPERLLCRSCRLDLNALQREHPDLGCRAVWCGKTTNLTSRRQDPVAGDDQRHRILRHGLADIARAFRSGAEFLCQGAMVVVRPHPTRRAAA